MEADELWLAVAGYHVVPLRERVGTEIYSRAAAGEAEARQAIVQSIRQLDRDSDESLGLTPRLELNVADAKDLILQILERWYEDIFRATEAETQAILVRDVEAKRAMAPR